jgi:hypothetical protein
MDTTTLARFRIFAKDMWCVENLNFLRDTDQYQGLIDQAQRLVAIYIAVGAEQEINISYNTRQAVLKLDPAVLSPAQRLRLFDDATQEVYTMVVSDTWVKFNANQRKRITPRQ